MHIAYRIYVFSFLLILTEINVLAMLIERSSSTSSSRTSSSSSSLPPPSFSAPLLAGLTLPVQISGSAQTEQQQATTSTSSNSKEKSLGKQEEALSVVASSMPAPINSLRLAVSLEDQFIASAKRGELNEAHLLSLLSSGVNIDAADQEGLTALMLAAMNNHALVVALLLKNKANAHATDQKDWTALKLAQMRGHANVASILAQWIAEHTSSHSSSSSSVSSSSSYEAQSLSVSAQTLMNQKGKLVVAADPAVLPPPLDFSTHPIEQEPGVAPSVSTAALTIAVAAATNPRNPRAPVPAGLSSIAEGMRSSIHAFFEQGLTPEIRASLLDLSAAFTLMLNQQESTSSSLSSAITTPIEASAPPAQATAAVNALNDSATSSSSGSKGEAKNDPKPDASPEVARLMGLSKYALISELIESVKRGDAAQVKLVLQTGVDVNAVDNQNAMTALMYAAKEGHREIAQWLLETGAHVDTVLQINKPPFGKGITALMMAASLGHAPVVQLLLDARANVNAVSRQGSTALTLALKRGETSEEECFSVISLLLAKKEKVIGLDTALKLAAHRGAAPLVQLLLDAGAHVNTKSVVTGLTVLMVAALSGSAPAVQLLLEAGADVNAVAKSDEFAGSTALILAIGSGNPQERIQGDARAPVVELLLRYKANINVKNRLHQTALQLAQSNGYLEIVKVFEKYSAKDSAKEPDSSCTIS